MEADSTRFRGQQENRYTIPLIALAFSFSLILLSWLLFNWLDYDTVAVMLLPLLALLTLLSGLLALLLRWLGFRPWRIETNGQGVYRYITVVAILIASAPACSYLYGIWITTSFVSAFDLNVRLESREFLLLEPGHPYDKHTPFRGITTVYTLLDPIAATKAKLRDRLHDRAWLAPFN